ncbi:hypothetical protein CUU64_15260 [Bacillus sp. V5-8f]|nr:hypothetical protein CUU64_15260 [Bacillus sp. V5-8f]
MIVFDGLVGYEFRRKCYSVIKCCPFGLKVIFYSGFLKEMIYEIKWWRLKTEVIAVLRDKLIVIYYPKFIYRPFTA